MNDKNTTSNDSPAVASVPTPFERFAVVEPEWIDSNGHMNVRRYMDVFYSASNAVFEYIGMRFDPVENRGSSIMTLGVNIDYLGELLLGEKIATSVQLLDSDHSKTHLYFETCKVESRQLSARGAILFIHVDMNSRKSHSFSPAMQEKLQDVMQAHRVLDFPEHANRQLGIRR